MKPFALSAALVSLALTMMMSVTSSAASPTSSDLSANESALGLFDGGQPPTQVNALLWRSRRPTRQDLMRLYQQGVRVIIDLEDDADAVQEEGTAASLMGFRFYSFPTDSFFAPDDAKMNQILNILRTTKVPVLVHCLHGEDRTGLVVGLERVLIEKWPAQKAYQEMLNKGFHEFFLGLVDYFHQKTGSSF